MNRLFILGALIVVVALLATPFILSTRNSGQTTYLDEMAAWHLEWSEAQTTADRQTVLAKLDGVRSPVGSDSIEFLDRHRIYVAAHVIFSRADELATNALRRIAVARAFPELGPNPNCDDLLTAAVNSADDRNEAAEMHWTREACLMLREARSNLVVVRSAAQAGWLKDPIQALISTSNGDS